ncbi:Ima1 N-terminal domain-containing protein [Xylariomycetidae sp. FL2044]|nr:Ima1 N-terminal domain-containing protein [Xylariomycetidae sp. FL2044]
MANPRSRKHLRCFYCGGKSDLRFEGQKSFLCTRCEATNWLDQNGEITDPPTSTLSVDRAQVQYAKPRSTMTRSLSPLIPLEDTTAQDSIFCGTCLRNQHMLTTSLAQFEWPDDPNPAEYAERERKYFALRKDLENRYPQMCPECEPKVEKKLHDANYTAQTDHLRRMMDRTRTHRQEVKNRGLLDILDLAGKWCWHTSFVLQFAWHITMLYALAVDMYTPGERDSWAGALLRMSSWINLDTSSRLDRLMQWAINLGMCSFPWNPRFKQTIRGFTAHILGFRQWYTHQLLILLIRFGCLSLAQFSKSRGLPAPTRLGAQLVLTLLTCHIYRVAQGSIHTDMTPLFQQQPKPLRKKENRSTPMRQQIQRDTNDLGSVLDDILTSSQPSHADAMKHSGAAARSQYLGVNDISQSNRHVDVGTPTSTFGSLQLSEPVASERVEPRPLYYEEEMDWSPSASQHRAFSSYNPYRVKNTNPRFNDVPIEPKVGPIWYKVPPAPTNPAQKLRNPPMRPIIRESPKEKKENFFQKDTRRPVDAGFPNSGKSSGIDVAEPKFFAPPSKDDPRDSLSSMFASSFSISPSPEDESERASRSRPQPRSIFGFGRSTNESRSRRGTRIAELVALCGALASWVSALGAEEQYGPTLALASICVCLIVSLRLAADLQVDAQVRDGKPPPALSFSLANVAFAQVVAALALVWSVWSRSATGISNGSFGNALFGVVMSHQMWHVFV